MQGLYRNSKAPKQEASLGKELKGQQDSHGFLELASDDFTLISWVAEPKTYKVPRQGSSVTLDVAVVTERDVFLPPPSSGT